MSLPLDTNQDAQNPNQVVSGGSDLESKITTTREGTRSWLAKASIFLLFAAIIIFSVIKVFSSKDLNDFNVIFSTVSGFVGVILGFYFGKEK